MKKVAAFIASGSGMGADAAKHLSSRGYDVAIMSSSGKGDMFLGVPYDVCLFTKMLLYVANETNTIPKKVEVSIIDAHIYLNHFDAVTKYMQSEGSKEGVEFEYQSGNLQLKDYKPGPKINAPVAI